jgi:hypothetical protein
MENDGPIIGTILKDCPYLDPNYEPHHMIAKKNTVNMFYCINIIYLKQIKYIFDNDIINMILTIEQHVFNCIIQNCIGLHIVTSTLGSGIFFSIQYITQYIQL